MKQKRYWLRGGVIGLAVLLLIILVEFILWQFQIIVPIRVTIVSRFIFLYGLVAALTGKYILHLPKEEMLSITMQSLVPFIFVVYFAIGTILGWLYGKIKNRKVKII